MTPLVIAACLAVSPIHEAPSGWSYPKDCCANQDCRPISCSTIIDHPDGSVSWLGLIFEKEKVKISHDASCHVCVGYDQSRRNVRYGHCIFLSPSM